MTARTLEIGRAVLASSTQELELWLTTLITISPVQHLLEFQQLPPISLLNLLSSGTVWTGRGPGLHVKLTVTLRGEPLPHQQMQDLIHRILEAPVWQQLRLQLALPNNVELQPGIARLNISHAEPEAIIGERRSCLIFSNVPAADVKPPDGVPRFDLEAVHFNMDILQLKRRPPTKRSRTSLSDICAKRTRLGDDSNCDEPSHNSFQELTLALNVVRRESELSLETSTTSASNPEWKEPNSLVPLRTGSSRDSCSPYGLGPRHQGALDNVQSHKYTDLAAVEFAELQLLVDGAMRLAVDGLSKSRSGLKIKTSTFQARLADTIPSLWRPGYLIALSQRAHLWPTISRSFSHIASIRGASVSLCNKLQRLDAASTDKSDAIKDSQHSKNEGVTFPISAVTDRLWIHLQKSCLARPLQPLQPFVKISAPSAAQPESDDILEAAGSPPEFDSMQLLPDDDDIIV